MGTFHEDIPDHIYSWILLQKMMWVSTAPLSKEGHINVSPKGGEYFGLLDKKTFWYMDLTGSGSETISHLRENGRITVMFNEFSGSPRIVRLWGHGRVLERESNEFKDFVDKNNVEVIPASRSIILVDVHQVGASCGYSVPYYEFKAHRKTLNQLFEKKQSNFEKGKKEESMDRYWAYKNAWSIDGLPGMQRGLETGAKENVDPIYKMVGPYAPAAPFGPKSYKLSSQMRRQLNKLDTAQISLTSVLFVALMMFLLGVLAAGYAPSIISAQRGKIERLLLLMPRLC